MKTDGKEKLLLVTTRKEAKSELKRIREEYGAEYEIIGIAYPRENPEYGEETEGVPVVCRAEDISCYIQTKWVDAVMISAGSEMLLPVWVIRVCTSMGVTVHCEVGDLTVTSGIRIIPRRQKIIKRVLDICGGTVGLILTGIITLFLAPAIWLSSPGPVFFSQTRIGQNGRRFKIYKFRSMYMDAEKRKVELMESNEMNGLMFKMEDDPRIIGSGPDGKRHGLGWFIRRTSLDEFPQFLNVLKGDMSLVGTRPPTEDEWMEYTPRQRARLSVKPGLTGIWQVSGRSSITDFDEVVRLDMEYVRNWDPALDLQILFKTVFVVFGGTGAK